jgi:hypothetical protein
MPHEKPPRFKLEGIDEGDRELLEYLSLEFRKIYNHYLKVIRETRILSKIKLEKKTTITARRRNVSYPVRSELLANTRQCARDKAVECVILYRSLKKANLKTDFPEFMYETIKPRLNWRDGYRINPDRSVRISVKKGGLVYARLYGSREDLKLIDNAFNNGYKFNSAEISKEGDDYFIYVNVTYNQRCSR